MNYLIFSTVDGLLVSRIPTTITDHIIAGNMVSELRKLFPEQEWDCSNADWTLQYK